MRDIRTAAELKGLWAAMPTPWTDSGKLDEAAIAVNVERYASIPVDGVYTTDSDGEFYAIELDEFQQLVKAFSGALRGTELGAQVGVTWTNTAGIADRIQICLEYGISAVHVCFPYWMPMRRDEMHGFWESLASAAPEARWIHYNSARGHLVLNGGDYRWMKQSFPDQFIGTKLCTSNLVELADCMCGTDDVAHFVTDFVTMPAMTMGARGCHSFWVNTLPEWTRELIDLAMSEQWEQAMRMQKRFLDWENSCVAPIAAQGYLHGIIGKARAELTGFLQDAGHVRAPYTPVPREIKQLLQRSFRQAWPEYVTAPAEPGSAAVGLR